MTDGTITWPTRTGARQVGPDPRRCNRLGLGSRLHRDSPSNYDDGVYLVNQSLPSARIISDLVFQGTALSAEHIYPPSGPSGKPNRRNMTTMLAFFSQFPRFL